MRCYLLAIVLAVSFSARPASAQRTRDSPALATSGAATIEVPITPRASPAIWDQSDAPGPRSFLAAPPPQTYWREGAILGGVLTALPAVALGLILCEDGCVWRIPMGAAAGALTGAVLGAFVGGQFERR